MKLFSLEIPDEPERLAAFLDQCVSGAELPELVAELRSLAAVSRVRPGLEEFLGSRRAPFLEHGFAAFPDPDLRQVLEHPELLLELQELVFLAGGEYWMAKLQPEDTRTATRTAWGILSTDLDRDTGPTGSRARPGLIRRRGWMAIVAVAAVLMVAGLIDRDHRPTVAWGWERPGVFDRELDRSSYLMHLADTASEWFATQPADPEQLAQRMQAFRRGCERLQQAPHDSLPQEDRAWLAERCRAWSVRLDQLVTELGEGRKSASVIQAEMDELARKLVAALRQRSVTT